MDSKNNDNIVVLKFGGSSMGDKDNLANNLPNILDIIKSYLAKNQKVIVVVSALAGETRRLKAIADQLFFGKDLKFHDGILSSGEVFSSNLLENFLNYNKLNSIALNADKLPIYTDSNYGNANIVKVDVDLIKKYLNLGLICIVPGYIGRDENNNTTTLGFDGSDTTAIAISGAIKATMCYLFKDVDGIFSCNPRRVSRANKINYISYKDMYAFSLLGARIIHPKAVEIAYKHDFPITILPNFNPKSSGTLIGSFKDNNMLNNNSKNENIVGLTYYPDNNDEINLAIIGNSLDILNKNLEGFVLENKIGQLNKQDNYLDNAILIKLHNKEDLDYALSKLHNFLGLDALDNMANKLNPNNQTYFDPAFKNKVGS
jgi:aspartate kinase